MSQFSLMDYAPIAIMFLVAIGFAASQLLVTQLIGPRKRTATKLMPYESGKDPVGGARDRYSIKFYTVAVIFLLFDIEVLFMVRSEEHTSELQSPCNILCRLLLE